MITTQCSNSKLQTQAKTHSTPRTRPKSYLLDSKYLHFRDESAIHDQSQTDLMANEISTFSLFFLSFAFEFSSQLNISIYRITLISVLWIKCNRFVRHPFGGKVEKNWFDWPTIGIHWVTPKRRHHRFDFSIESHAVHKFTSKRRSETVRLMSQLFNDVIMN